MTETKMFTDLLTARSNMYRLFSDLYYGLVDAELYERLQAMLPLIADMAEAMDDRRLAEAAAKLGEKLDKTETDDEFYSLIRRAFTRLYLLGSHSLSLHESVWMSQEKEMKKEPYFKIRAYYKAFNFERTSKTRESDESLTVMLLFMSVLSQAAADQIAKHGFDKTADEYMKAQSRFLEDHLLQWVPEICDKSVEIATKNNLSLYGELAELLKEYLGFDNTTLKDMLLEFDQ